jgi:hypothetical protein
MAISVVAFAAGLVACAARGWHAPRWWVIVPIVAVTIALSLAAAELWHRGRSMRALAGLGERRAAELHAAATEARKVLALMSTLAYAVMSGGALRLALDHAPRVPASFLASAWLATLPWVALAAFRLVLSWVHFGRDGVRVSGRFVPFRAVRAVRVWKTSLHVESEGAPLLVLKLPSEDAAREVAAHVEAARRSMPTSGAGFARAGRPPRVWKRALLETGYRSAGVGPEQAEEVLASPAASPDERVGAAMVLAASGPEGRAHVRVAASALADPRVRVAVERAAEGEVDDATLAAIAELR